MSKKKKNKEATNVEVTAENIPIEIRINVADIETQALAGIAEIEAEIAHENATAFKTTTENSTETATATATETAAATTAESSVPADSTKITDRGEIIQALESIIFAAPKAMSLVRLKNLLNAFNYDSSELSGVLEEMMGLSENKGFQLRKVAGGYQYRSHPKNSDLLQKLLEDRPARLSASALEVLAIIAYKQPLTRTEVDTIRGTDSGHLMRGLLEKNLVRTGGHAETPGRPLLYETTPYFLEVFSLASLDDLPILEEFKRELAEGQEGGVEGGFNVLESDPGFFDKASPLAANPDRGAFDENPEDRAELPDFGTEERAAEESPPS